MHDDALPVVKAKAPRSMARALRATCKPGNRCIAARLRTRRMEDSIAKEEEEEEEEEALCTSEEEDDGTGTGTGADEEEKEETEADAVGCGGGGRARNAEHPRISKNEFTTAGIILAGKIVFPGRCNAISGTAENR